MCNFHLPPPPTPQAKQQPNLILIPFVLCTPIPLLLFVLAPPALTFLLLSIFLDLSLSVLAKWLTYFPRRKERDSRLGGRSPRFLGQWDTRENASPIFSSPRAQQAHVKWSQECPETAQTRTEKYPRRLFGLSDK